MSDTTDHFGNREEMIARHQELQRQLASVTAERDENHRMWEHWQTESVKNAGELSRMKKCAEIYKNAFDVACKQRDEATELLKSVRQTADEYGKRGEERLNELFASHSREHALRERMEAIADYHHSDPTIREWAEDALTLPVPPVVPLSECKELVTVIQMLICSASPNSVEHPKMHESWTAATSALANFQAKHGKTDGGIEG